MSLVENSDLETHDNEEWDWGKIFSLIICVLVVFAVLYLAFYFYWSYIVIQTHVPEDQYPGIIKLAYKLDDAVVSFFVKIRTSFF